MYVEVDDPDAEELELGAAPRPPLSRRARRRLTAVGAVLVAGLVVAGLALGWGHDAAPRPTAAPAATPSPDPSDSGFAGGPVLTEVGGQTELTVPGGAMFGGAAMNVALAAAPAKIAIVRQSLPTFTAVRGGVVTDPDIHYGLYLEGTYTTPGGAMIDLDLYTARAPGTTYGADQLVSRGRNGHSRTVKTDVSVFTGTGWWVHLIAVSPDTPGLQTGQAAALLPIATAPALVT